MEFLRSLVDHGSLQYSLRERRWIYDEEKIASEDISDNVSELFSSKMNGLSERTQQALMISSCFASRVSSALVKSLMKASPIYTGLLEALEGAVRDGFMNKNEVGLTWSYSFVHDKVRESAYSLIRQEEKDEFRFRIGMHLWEAAQEEDIDAMIFCIVDQINHGSAIVHPDQRICIAELNYKAASKAIQQSNFDGSYLYASAAVNLLPPGESSWEKSTYILSKNIYSVLGNGMFGIDLLLC